MNALRCVYVSCAVFITALAAANSAHAQRVRFGSPDEYFSPTAADTAPGSNTAPIFIVAQADPLPLTTSSSSVGPITSAPTLMASSWDPYRVAQRSGAMFTGTIQSTPGQFLVPQPMPRVPYYSQQPVVSAGPQAVVVPAQTTPAPPVFPTTVQPGPIVPATVPPQVVIPPATPVVATPPPILPPPIKTSQCYAYADAIFFTRDAEIGNQPLVLLDGNAPTQSNVLLSTADLDFNWAVGPRVTLGRDFDAFRAFEATYFGIYNFQATGTVTGDNNLNLPGDLGLAAGLDFFNADQVTVDYTAIINNGELNYLQTYGGLSWLVGFRYFNLAEKFSITSTDNQTGTSFYNISSYNNLFGGQIGARISEPCGTCTSWSYDITGKAGVYGNDIFTSQTVGDFSGFTLRSVKENIWTVAFLGEIDFNANYALNPTWSIRGGYQVFWVDGLALAPNQLDFSDAAGSGTHVDKTGGMFMQGAHAGLMARW